MKPPPKIVEVVMPGAMLITSFLIRVKFVLISQRKLDVLTGLMSMMPSKPVLSTRPTLAKRVPNPEELAMLTGIIWSTLRV